MKKFGMLAVTLVVLGSVVVGCEPAKKKEPAKDAPKAAAPAEGAAPAGDKPADEAK